MVFLLCLLAIGMIAIGCAAMAFGMSIVQVERGWTMVISGSVGATGGVVLLGLALAVQRLGRVASELVWIRDRLATIGEMTAEGAAWGEATTVTDVDPPDAGMPVGGTAPAPQAEPVIVGQYSSGGNEYKMYSDGSIDAMTPAGLRRFGSLEELRAFVAGGGERAR